jgi:hypothetical protein
MVVAIAIGLVIVTSLYAAVLNIKRIREWYTPDRTYVTVVIGDGLILAALACLVPAGVFTFWQWWIAFVYTLSAGIPIIIWQRLRKIQRQRRAAKALERE